MNPQDPYRLMSCRTLPQPAHKMPAEPPYLRRPHAKGWLELLIDAIGRATRR